MLVFWILLVLIMAALGAVVGRILYNRRPEEAEGQFGRRRPRRGLIVGGVVGALLGIAIYVTVDNWGAPDAETYGARSGAVSVTLFA